MWVLRKVRLYGDNPSVQQSQSQIAPGELRGVAGGGELCLEGETDTGIPQMYICSSTVCSSGVCLCTVCSLSSGSAHSYGCVVNGPSAMATSYELLLLLRNSTVQGMFSMEQGVTHIQKITTYIVA